MSDGKVALIAAGVSLVVGVLTVVASISIARLQAKQAVELKREDLRTEYMAEAAIRRLLMHTDFKKRTFGVIKKRLGDGFDDTELRKLLVRAGAVRLPDPRGEDRELWGLVERNTNELG
ncbi:hypothetical protein ACH4Y0_08680 [Streptomyces sp. NPDC020707]|uniref:Uncharacterized protein n=1 Tax=Streptomyces ortus TaxID=2867268 RepID=A0ABT3V651_9ACTN|nr:MULTISPECIES: hypothetical protein [Streptomyces]MCX4233836.1 hypothetical protein [Streptomyces ortus]